MNKAEREELYEREKAYRRGYSQGASAMLDATEAGLRPAVRHVMRAWLNTELRFWRYRPAATSHLATMETRPPGMPTIAK